jgi:G3E family GTPase
MARPVPVHLVCGWLGAGKTTLLIELLGQQPPQERLAILVNEFGRLGIDGQLLAERGAPVKELAAGCICCSLRGDFVGGLQELVDRHEPGRVLVEATGLAEAKDLIPCVHEAGQGGALELASVVTVVDAEMFEHRQDLGPSFLDQISAADLVLFNKIDLLPPELVERLLAALALVNPRARLLPTAHCRLDRDLLLETEHAPPPPDREGGGRGDLLPRPGPPPGRPEGDGFLALAFEEPGVLDPERLEGFLAGLPWQVLRIKGFLRLPQGMQALNYTYRRPQLTPWPQDGPNRLAMVVWRMEPGPLLAGLRACLGSG